MRHSAFALLASTALAAPAPRDVLPTIVFTPGAWHGTWAFDMVRDSLKGLGYPTEAVALPSVGNTNASVGVAEDAAALAAELATLTDAGKDVVMVCHSYGGVVASTAVEGYGYKNRTAAGLDGGVIMLVYMTAFAAPAGTSLLDALGDEYLWWMQPDSTVSGLDRYPRCLQLCDLTLTKSRVSLLQPPTPARYFMRTLQMKPLSRRPSQLSSPSRHASSRMIMRTSLGTTASRSAGSSPSRIRPSRLRRRRRWRRNSQQAMSAIP